MVAFKHWGIKFCGISKSKKVEENSANLFNRPVN